MSQVKELNYTRDEINALLAKAGLVSNPNLFDNPNWVINQRGLTEYKGNGNGIDRWFAFSNDGINNLIFPQPSGGVKIISPASITTRLQQFITELEKVKNKTLTFSIKIATSIGALNVYRNVDGTYTQILSEISQGVHNVTFEVGDISEKFGIFFQTNIQGADIDIEWVKLEEGSIATPFITPDSTLELLKCQKYLVSIDVFTTQSSVYAIATDYVQFTFNLPVANSGSNETLIGADDSFNFYTFSPAQQITGFTYSVIVNENSTSALIIATKEGHGVTYANLPSIRPRTGTVVLISTEPT